MHLKDLNLCSDAQQFLGQITYLLSMKWFWFGIIIFSTLTLYLFFSFFKFQNYINESLKYLDKSYPNTSLAGLHTPMSDTKPIYIDTKALLGHHVDNNKNNTKWLWFRRKENTQKNITIVLDHPKYQKNFGHLS